MLSLLAIDLDTGTRATSALRGDQVLTVPMATENRATLRRIEIPRVSIARIKETTFRACRRNSSPCSASRRLREKRLAFAPVVKHIWNGNGSWKSPAR